MKKCCAVFVVVLGLALVIGCKPKEQEVGVGVTPVGKVGKAPGAAKGEKAQAPSDLPKEGDKIPLTIQLGPDAETEEFEVVPIREAALKEFGVPTYPGAVGIDPTDPEEKDEESVAMLTSDAVDKVASYYKSECPGLVDQTEAMKAMMKAIGEIGAQMGKVTGEKGEAQKTADEAEKALKEFEAMNLQVLEDSKKDFSIAVLPSGKYSVILVGSGSLTGGGADQEVPETAPPAGKEPTKGAKSKQ